MPTQTQHYIVKNINELKDSINKVSKLYKQNVNIIAVTKNQSIDDIIIAINAGISHFAENYVQEANSKYTQLKQQYPHIKLHLIGSLQTNKVKLALDIFDFIHTIDSTKLLLKITNYNFNNKSFFIQVRLDDNKAAGCNEQEAAEILSLALEKKVNIVGLMGVLPLNNKDTTNGLHTAPYFAYLNQLANNMGLPHLSMGMSNDYTEAVKFGASYVRIGSLIFAKAAD